MTMIIVTNEGIIADQYVDSDNIRATGHFMRTKIFHDPELNAFIAVGVRGIDPDEIATLAKFGFNKYREYLKLEVTEEVLLPEDLKSFEMLLVTAPYGLKSTFLMSCSKEEGFKLVRFKADVCYTYGHESAAARIAYDFTGSMFKAFKVACQNYVTISRIYNFVDFKNIKDGIQNGVC